MGLETKTKTIMGDKYVVTQFTARKGFRAAAELARIVGPTLATLMDNSEYEGKDATSAFGMQLPPGIFSSAVTMLMDRADPDLVEPIIDKLMDQTKVQVNCEGNAMELSNIMESHFAGKGLAKMLKWMEFSLEVQFKDFIGSLSENGRGELQLEDSPKAE